MAYYQTIPAEHACCTAREIVWYVFARQFVERIPLERKKMSVADVNGKVAHIAQRLEHYVSPVDLERLVGLEFIRATEAGALTAYKWMGKGDKESADFAACDAIRGLFDTVNLSGLVTIAAGLSGLLVPEMRDA